MVGVVPVLGLVGGPPGSGKTTLARLVGERLGMPVISPRTLEVLTGAGVSVVAEAAFTTRLAVEARRFAGVADVRLVACVTSPDRCRQRVAERAVRRADGSRRL
jgi:predicted kinase